MVQAIIGIIIAILVIYLICLAVAAVLVCLLFIGFSMLAIGETVFGFLPLAYPVASWALVGLLLGAGLHFTVLESHRLNRPQFKVLLQFLCGVLLLIGPLLSLWHEGRGRQVAGSSPAPAYVNLSQAVTVALSANGYYGIGVRESSLGVISLTGAVGTLQIKNGIEDTVRRVPGVKQVESSLVVNTPGDSVIASTEILEKGQALTEILEKGQALYDSGKYKAAEKILRQGIKKEPQPNRQPDSLAQAYYLLALTCNKLNRYQEAVQEFRSSLKLKWENPQGLSGLAWAYYQQKQYQDAINAANQAIGMDGKYADPYYNRGLAYLRLGQMDEARHQVASIKSLDASLAERLQKEINAAEAPPPSKPTLPSPEAKTEEQAEASVPLPGNKEKIAAPLPTPNLGEKILGHKPTQVDIREVRPDFDKSPSISPKNLNSIDQTNNNNKTIAAINITDKPACVWHPEKHEFLKLPARTGFQILEVKDIPKKLTFTNEALKTVCEPLIDSSKAKIKKFYNGRWVDLKVTLTSQP